MLLGAFFAANAQNPIFKDAFTADPSPLVHNGRLYVYVGQDEATGDQLFYMTGWRCYSTTDMKTWTSHGVIMKPTDFSWGAADAWASQVVHKDGKFYLYVTVTGKSPYGGRNVGVAVSDSPTGPFKDARGTPLIRDNMTNNGKTWDDIDPTVFIDDDGQAYLCWGNPICYLVKLKPNMTEIDGTISQITPPNYAEGPWLYKRNNLYYLVYPAFVAGVGSEQMCYTTATNINGPWTYRGVLSGAAKNSYTIHPGIVEYKGQNYFFYHNATLTLNGLGPATGRRSVCVEYLCYNADGTITQTTAGISVASPCPPVVVPVTQAPFKGTAWPIPGRIEAEDYDIGGEGVAFHEANTSGNQGAATYRNDEVDIEKTSDLDGTNNVGYTLNGEWLEFSVNVSATDKYNLSLRVATDGAGKTMHAEIDGINITGAITVPNTSGFQTWQTVIVSNLSLTAGKHTLRLAFDADYVNLNYVKFDKATVTGNEEEADAENTQLAYPNPFENAITLNHKNEFNYKIFDLSGKLMLQGNAKGQLSVGEELQGGVYLLEVVSNDKSYLSKIHKK
jgi:hypothetical protein